MDGTLIDSSIVIANSINYVREKLSLPHMETSQIIASINNVNIHAPSFFYEAQNFTKQHNIWFQDYYTKHHDKDTILYSGIKELLDKLSSTHKLSIATNAYKLSAFQILKSTGINSYFDIVMCADEVKQAKPHREMLDVIVKHYNAKREEFVVIGDGERDIISAKNAGIDSILVDWGFSNHTTKAVRSVKELEKIITFL
jgi:phosphoglycolate phosphatase